jgi:hypothetical protein
METPTLMNKEQAWSGLYSVATAADDDGDIFIKTNSAKILPLSFFQNMSCL